VGAAWETPHFSPTETPRAGKQETMFSRKITKKEILKPENRKAREPEIQGAPMLIRDLPIREELADSRGGGRA
jgi:hypothetical protein